MKTTVNNLKKLFRNLAEAGHVDRSKRKARGYAEQDIDVDYTDIHEETDEGVSQSKRLARGYALEEPADYDVNEADVPVALRAKIYTIQPANDPFPAPPVDAVDQMEPKDDCSCDDDGDAMDEVTPPGFEKIVRGLKKNPDVDNPWAVANAMKNKGIKPKKESRAPMPTLKSILKKK